jgi:hypothetical protein
MRLGGVVGLLLVVGCATPRVVHLDTGRGAPVTYTAAEVEPVEVSEDEFKAALMQLVLDMRLDVAFREADEADQRGGTCQRG